MNKNTLEILFSLHEAVAQEFLNRIQNGEASPADLSAATKFLKDNGIQLEQKSSDTDPMTLLLESIEVEEPKQLENKKTIIKPKSKEDKELDEILLNKDLLDSL